MHMNPGSLVEKNVTAIPRQFAKKKQLIPVDSIFQDLDSAKCDVIMLRNGEEIKGKVLEINLTEVKYKRCDNPNGPIISLRKQDVFIIKYANGTKDVINNATTQSNPDETSAAIVCPEAIAGFILALAAFPISLFLLFLISELALPVFLIFTIAGLVLSGIALAKINRNPEKYRSRGLEIAGLVFGILGAVIGSILALLTYFF